MSNQNRKTKSILINPKFQWTIIGYTAGLATLILVTILTAFEFGIHALIQKGNDAGLQIDHFYFQMIRSFDASFQHIFIYLSLMVAMTLLVGGLIVSHKIAGPIRRLQNAFLDMQKENDSSFQEVSFRKGDFFPELAESYNEVFKKNHSKDKTNNL